MNSRDRMLAGLPLSRITLQAGGAATTVLEGGQGPPLLLLHGGIECGGAVWAPIMARLAEQHRLVVPDLPGLGESEPMAGIDAETVGDWLRDLLREVFDEPPVLIAHSLIGGPAARFAAGHAALLRRLVIYASPAIGPYRMPFGLRVVAIRFSLRPTERNAERFDRWAFFDFDAARAGDPGWFEAFNSYSRERARVRHVKRTMRALVANGTDRVPDDELRRIEIPTTLVWGRHDRFVPVAVGEDASRRLGWRLEVIEGTGHVPHIERPDAFLAALDASG